MGGLLSRFAGYGEDERGFTLPEVMIDILAGTAIPYWLGIVEGRGLSRTLHDLIGKS